MKIVLLLTYQWDPINQGIHVYDREAEKKEYWKENVGKSPAKT
jgi:hypothetical protein